MSAPGPSGCLLAQFNLAWAKRPLDHPDMAGFAAALDEVHRLATSDPDFVWAPEGDEAGSASVLFGSELALANLSLWRSIEGLRRFTYQGRHGDALRRRRDWFEPSRGSAYVLWWVPVGERPDLREARRRLEYLDAHGPTADAFTFADVFDPPAAAGATGG